MVSLTDMKGQELVDITEDNGEIHLVFKNSKYVLRARDGKIVLDIEQ